VHVLAVFVVVLFKYHVKRLEQRLGAIPSVHYYYYIIIVQLQSRRSQSSSIDCDLGPEWLYGLGQMSFCHPLVGSVLGTGIARPWLLWDRGYCETGCYETVVIVCWLSQYEETQLVKTGEKASQKDCMSSQLTNCSLHMFQVWSRLPLPNWSSQPLQTLYNGCRSMVSRDQQMPMNVNDLVIMRMIILRLWLMWDCGIE